jgi:carboxyl-terminal processing protease
MGKRSPYLAAVLVAVVFFTGLFSGVWSGRAAPGSEPSPYGNLERFARVLTTIEKDFVEPFEEERLIESAIRGMVSDLDAHSRWMTPTEYRRLIDDTQGEYEGIGIEVRNIDSGILITRVIPNSPATVAGLKRSDIIIAIDAISVIDLPIPEVSRALKGPRGSSVELTVQRATVTEPLLISTKRDKVIIPAVESHALPNGIAYIKLIQFQRGAAEEMTADIKNLFEQGTDRGLILDLRNNPGGLLEEAIAVADLFFDDGLIVTTRSRVEGEQTYRATASGLHADLPVAVLVNGMSASAAEIVASALQDRARGKVLGTQTYGKGSVQTIYENSDQSALKLTIGRYYTPSGEPVAAKHGRLPDIIIEENTGHSMTEALRKNIEELASDKPQKMKEMLDQLEHLSETPTNSQVPKVYSDDFSDRLKQDSQLKAAHEYLLKH